MISSPSDMPCDVNLIKQNSPIAEVVRYMNVVLPYKNVTLSSLWSSTTAPESTKGVLLGSVAGTGLFDQIENRNNLNQQHDLPVFFTCSEMIHQLTKNLSISILAEILDVTRPTIYSWQHEKEPQKEKQSRIESVFQLLSPVDTKRLSLLSKVWNRKLSGSQSVYEVLTAKTLNETDFKNAMNAVEPLFQKLINRDLQKRKTVSELAAETSLQNSSEMKEWDKLPPAGLEII